MRAPLVNYGWNLIETAPFDEDIALQVTDGHGKTVHNPMAMPALNNRLD
jgi:hypothetical protein